MAKLDMSFSFDMTHEGTAAKPVACSGLSVFIMINFFVKVLDILIPLHYCINHLVQ